MELLYYWLNVWVPAPQILYAEALTRSVAVTGDGIP